VKILEDIDQQSERWFRMRAGRPTASQFSRILTPGGKHSSQWEDYAIELCAESIRPDEIKWEGNFHTGRGNALEPEARELFAETMADLAVHQVGFVTRDDGVVGCSPDAMVADADGDWVAGLEIKCPLSKHHAHHLVSGALPSDYRPQVHGGMAVTGLGFWYFMSYCPELQPLILRIERDEYTEKLSGALDEFLIYYAKKREEIMPVLTGKILKQS